MTKSFRYDKERINKMSCKEFATKYTNWWLCCEECAYYDKSGHCNSLKFGIDDCKTGFEKWLEQEADLFEKGLEQ